jgi:hypothetical protein
MAAGLHGRPAWLTRFDVTERTVVTASPREAGVATPGRRRSSADAFRGGLMNRGGGVGIIGVIVIVLVILFLLGVIKI